jgi:uncharacterized protein YkwD
MTTTPRLRPVHIALPLLLGAALAPATVASSAPAREAPEAVTLRLLNDTRTAHGLPPLRSDTLLARAASAHSRDMVARGYFSHRTPGGAGLGTRVARTGWMRSRGRWRLGEDLAWGTGRLASPKATVAAWMHSDHHRHILLERAFRVVGIGIARGTPGAGAGATFTADFGS